MEEILNRLQSDNTGATENIVKKKLIDFVIKNGKSTKRQQHFNHFLNLLNTSIYQMTEEILKDHLSIAFDLSIPVANNSQLKTEILNFPKGSIFEDTSKQSLEMAFHKLTFLLDVLLDCLQKNEFRIAIFDCTIFLRISKSLLSITPSTSFLPEATKRLFQMQEKLFQLIHIICQSGNDLIVLHSKSILEILRGQFVNSSQWRALDNHKDIKPYIRLRCYSYNTMLLLIKSGIPGNDATLSRLFTSLLDDLNFIGKKSNFASLFLTIASEFIQIVLQTYYLNLHIILQESSLFMSTNSNLTHAYGSIQLWHRFMSIFNTILHHPKLKIDLLLINKNCESLALALNLNCLQFVINDWQSTEDIVQKSTTCPEKLRILFESSSSSSTAFALYKWPVEINEYVPPTSLARNEEQMDFQTSQNLTEEENLVSFSNQSTREIPSPLPEDDNSLQHPNSNGHNSLQMQTEQLGDVISVSSPAVEVANSNEQESVQNNENQIGFTIPKSVDNEDMECSGHDSSLTQFQPNPHLSDLLADFNPF